MDRDQILNSGEDESYIESLLLSDKLKLFAASYEEPERSGAQRS